jgi:hypothetical protein
MVEIVDVVYLTGKQYLGILQQIKEELNRWISHLNTNANTVPTIQRVRK